MVRLACEPMPAIRCANSTRYGFDAVQFCERTFTVEPTASIASLVPSICSTPKMFVSFAIVCVAPAPKSTRATLMMSAASTYPCTLSKVFLPKRPASCASSLSFSRGVRVSRRINALFSSSTDFSVIPVYFRVLASCSSISAYAFTAFLPAITKPVTAAAMPIMKVCALLSQLFIFSHRDC